MGVSSDITKEKKSYRITDPIYGRVITVTTDKPMTEELGGQFLHRAFGGKLTFDDLANDKNYLTDLKADHWKTVNEKWEGTDEELIEKDFEYFNMLEMNLVYGAKELATTFANLDKKDAQRLLRRFDVYDRTGATGEGSRSGWEQFKGVSKAMITDPTSYAGGYGIFKLLASKLGAKGAMRFILTKIAAPATIGATYGAVANFERQQMEKQLGARESIDPSELGSHAMVGAAVGPLATPAVKLAGKAMKFVNPKAYISGAEKIKKSVFDTLGGSKAAQEAVIDEGKKKLQREGGHASSVESANVSLTDELAKANSKFEDEYKALGELDVRPQHIIKLYNKMINKGIKKGKLGDLEDAVNQMKLGQKSPTDALREIKAALGSAAYGKDFKAFKNILIGLKEDANKLFNDAAKRSGKGKEVADLDARYSDFLKLDKRIKQSTGSESKVSNLIGSITSSPRKSAVLIKEYLSEINRIGRHSGNENFVTDQIELLKSSLSEHMFKGTGGTFTSFVETESGRKSLLQLYPEVSEKTFQNWAKIIETSKKHGGAATFWGRMFAQILGGGAGYHSQGLVGGLAGMIGMSHIIRSPKFQSMAMKIYSKSYKPKDLNRMQSYLVEQGMTEANARSFIKQIAGQVVTQSVAKNPPEIAVQGAEQFKQRVLPTAPAGQ